MTHWLRVCEDLDETPDSPAIAVNLLIPFADGPFSVQTFCY